MSGTSQLFSPFRMRGLTLANRIVVPPMCRCSADYGSANDWHMMHIGSLANSGAGLFIVEATAVEAGGPHHARLRRALVETRTSAP